MLPLLLLGCRADCDAEVTPGLTAHQVTVDLPHTARSATLTLTLDGEPAGGLPMTGDGSTLTAALNGLPALTAVDFTVDADSGRQCRGGFTTDNLPPALPELTVTDRGGRSDAPLLLGALIGEAAAVFIIDRQGRYRWHQLVEEGAVTSDVHLIGTDIASNRYDSDRVDDIGEVRFQSLLGEPGESVRTEWGHHVFSPLPDGGLAWPALDIRAWTDPATGETIDVVGDRILRSDGAEVFSIWDVEEPVIDEENAGFYNLGYDWSHANALQALPDGYLLSLGHLDAVYDLDEDGAVRARYHPDDVIEGSPWDFQHDPTYTDAGTLLLVSHEPEATVAREYAISDAGLSEIWSVEGPLSGFLGQARRLEGGNTLVNFGGKGILREVTPAGETVWQVEVGLGSWFGNVQLIDDVLGTAGGAE